MKVVAFLIFIFYAKFCIGQNIVERKLLETNKESYINVADSIIKSELGAFCAKANEKTELINKSHENKLIEIYVYKCSDTFAYFVRSNFFTSELLTIGLYSSGIKPNLKLDKISVLFYKQYVDIPESELTDIINPMFCQQFTKKGKPIMCNCKVFQSVDKRRVYIHMINGQENDKYEVTWIIRDRKYYGRVIDKL